MCGLAGILTSKNLHIDNLIAAMTESLRHRGPDGGGVWVDNANNVALGHRRLSLIDISETGSQPMTLADSNLVIVFNGEIYNYIELRSELLKSNPSIIFKGTSDTEVFLHAINKWGISKSLQKASGMFAFAMFDRTTRKLFLARDRFGEKPIYYTDYQGVFLFASELKSILASNLVKTDVSDDALASFVRYSYIPAPMTIYDNIYKLPPGTIMEVHLAGTQFIKKIHSWWDSDNLATQSKSNKNFLSSAAELNELLNLTINSMTRSDAPIGAFLSGGVDSSTIASIMQSQSLLPIDTFSVGFDDTTYDESVQASLIAKYIGAKHNPIIVTSADMIDVVTLLPSIYDEPFADASQIPTYLLAKFTKNHVKSTLSGDGGDEVFGGYNRYLYGPKLLSLIKKLPYDVRFYAHKILSSFPPDRLDRIYRSSFSLLKKSEGVRSPGEKIHKLIASLMANNREELFKSFISTWLGELPTKRGTEVDLLLPHLSVWNSEISFARKMMAIDMGSYLVDDILVKVDRASMYAGLEVRAPFLNHNVVRFASDLPDDFLYKKNKGKLILRQVLSNYLPDRLTSMPKSGFAVPIHQWLRTDLRDWAESLLDPIKIENDGYFDSKSISSLWHEHLTGKRNHQYALWPILCFNSWRSQ